jgi:hypothetical protein
VIGAVLWCGVVLCGVVWCGVVWCGVLCCGVVWCSVVCADKSTFAEERSLSVADKNIILCLNINSLLCSLQYGYSCKNLDYARTGRAYFFKFPQRVV